MKRVKVKLDKTMNIQPGIHWLHSKYATLSILFPSCQKNPKRFKMNMKMIMGLKISEKSVSSRSERHGLYFIQVQRFFWRLCSREELS